MPSVYHDWLCKTKLSLSYLEDKLECIRVTYCFLLWLLMIHCVCVCEFTFTEERLPFS